MTYVYILKCEPQIPRSYNYTSSTKLCFLSPVVREFFLWLFKGTWEAFNNPLTKQILHCWHKYTQEALCIYEKSKMAASSHGSHRMTINKVLEEIFAHRDLVTRKVKTFLNTMALKKMTKAAKKSKVSRNMTARVLVKTVKVKRKKQHLTESNEEEEVVVVEELKLVLKE